MTDTTSKPRLTARRRRGLELLLDDIDDVVGIRYVGRVRSANLHVRLTPEERAKVREAVAFLQRLAEWHRNRGAKA